MSVGTGDVDFVLASANTLAAEGRSLEAIDRLTEWNRGLRDPRVAGRLVELRGEAFADLPRTPGRPSWPPVLEDPWPDEVGVPTIVPHELDARTLGGAITNHGAVLVRGLVDKATTERLCRRIDQAFDARARVMDGDPIESASPWFVPYEPGSRQSMFRSDVFVRTVDVPDVLAELVETFEMLGVTSAISGYLMERPVMIAHKWVIRRVPTGSLLPDFHQDGAFLGEGIRTVDCWVALTDCGPGTGRPAMDFMPRRMAGILPTGDGAIFDWATTEQRVMSSHPGVELCSPVFEAGDALIFDERLAHRTSLGEELTTRYALESWFVAPSSFPPTPDYVPIVL